VGRDGRRQLIKWASTAACVWHDTHLIIAHAAGLVAATGERSRSRDGIHRDTAAPRLGDDEREQVQRHIIDE